MRIAKNLGIVEEVEEDEMNEVQELRSIIERKARAKRSPKWMGKEEKKGSAKKKERKKKAKTAGKELISNNHNLMEGALI